MTAASFRSVRKFSVLGASFLVLALVLAGTLTSRAHAATATTINLGTAGNASVLAGSGVTNTGSSVLALDLDTAPTPAITGFPPGQTLGTEHADDAVAQIAQNDLTTAYNQAVAAPSTNNVTGVDLSGMTLTQGVYTASSDMSLDGPLPLTLSGNAASVFIFQAGSTLTTGSNVAVLLTGGVLACNVFWQVGSSATIGSGTAFVGNILALTSISLNAGASVDGRALAINGAVTLSDNAFASPGCGTSPTSTTSSTAAGPTTTAAGPTTTAAGPTTTIAGPTTTIAGPTTTIAGPTTTAAGATTTAAGATTTAAGATTTAAGATTTAAGATTTAAGATTTAAGGATTSSSQAATTSTLSTSTAAGASTGSGTSGGGGGGATLIGGSGSGGLAFTGLDLRPLLEVALLIMLTGSVLVVMARRRRHHPKN